MRFEFATATQIIFGSGAVQEVGAHAEKFGKAALFVMGHGGADPAGIPGQLKSHGIRVIPFNADGEPTVDLVERGAQTGRDQGCDFVIACGGGSAVDAGKAISALLTNPGDVLDYLEVIGKAQPIQQPAAPFIAIPTTAGTGAEVTRNAVLFSAQHRFKASMRSPLMLPRLAIIDPELTFSLPPAVTASTGMDAITQVIEPFVSLKANPLVDPLCRDGIRHGARSIRKAFISGRDAQAREDMSLTSLMGGLALANAGLGAVHGFASPIGGMFPAPHGAVCARLLGPVMAANLRALRERAPDSDRISRYGEIAHLLTGEERATAEDGIRWVEQLCEDLEIPRLAAYGISLEDIPELVEKGRQASSMKANPIPLTSEELAGILQAAL